MSLNKIKTRDPLTIVAEIKKTEALLKSASNNYAVASLAVASSGQGHNNDAFMYKAEVNALKKSIDQLKEELNG